MTLASGTRIGPYEISTFLAAGGMGEVYRAVDTRLGRPVAIKLLFPSENLRERLRRFEVETRAVSVLQQANILVLYDVGVFDGRPFLVSELLEGETLRSLLNRSAVPSDRAVDYAAQLCHGIAAAHDKGIVHRDIKPENLFITGDGVLKICDFGIAKRTESPRPMGNGADRNSTATATDRTETGTVLGTAGYMSPEQVRGGAAEQASDIFSVGSVLYEMLAGWRAFQRDTALETAYAILKDEPPALPPNVPPALDGIVRRCLQKQPSDRFPSAHALGLALEACRDSAVGRPFARRHQPRAPGAFRAGKSSGRIRNIVLAVTASATSLATGSWLAWRHFRDAPVASRITMAVLPFEDFSGDSQKEYFADGLTDGMISQLGRLEPEKLAVIARTSVAQYRHTQKSIKQIGQELGAQYILECSMQHTDSRLRIDARLIQASDQTQIWAQRYDREVKDVLTVQSEVAQAIAGKARLKVAPEQAVGLANRLLNPDAYDAYLKGRFFAERMTPEATRQAAAYFQQATVLDPNWATAYAMLAQMTVVQQMNGFARPDEVGPRARSLALRALELDDSLADGHHQLAFIHLSHDWDWAGAQREFRRAMDLDPSNADIRRRYASEFLSSIGRHAEAIAELRRAAELAPLSFPVHTMLGRTYYHARRNDEAIAELTRATALESSPLPRIWLGLALAAEGRFGEGIDELRKTGDMIDACVGARGYVLAQAGHRAEAEKVLDQLLARSESRYVAGNFIAQVYVGLGRYDETFAWLEKAYAAHSFQLIFLRVDPTWDGVRDDPRFVDLVRRVGIPAQGAF